MEGMTKPAVVPGVTRLPLSLPACPGAATAARAVPCAAKPAPLKPNRRQLVPGWDEAVRPPEPRDGKRPVVRSRGGFGVGNP